MAYTETSNPGPPQTWRAPGSFLSAILLRNVPTNATWGLLFSSLLELRKHSLSFGKNTDINYLLQMTSLEKVRKDAWIVGFSDSLASTELVEVFRKHFLDEGHAIHAEIFINMPTSQINYGISEINDEGAASVPRYESLSVHSSFLLVPRYFLGIWQIWDGRSPMRINDVNSEPRTPRWRP